MGSLSWGMLLLSIWVLLQGLIGLLSLSFNSMGIIMSILALVAGVLLLVGK